MRKIGILIILLGGILVYILLIINQNNNNNNNDNNDDNNKNSQNINIKQEQHIDNNIKDNISLVEELNNKAQQVDKEININEELVGGKAQQEDLILNTIQNGYIDKVFCNKLDKYIDKLKCKLELKAREKRKIFFETTEKAKNNLDISLCNKLEKNNKNNCISGVIETQINLGIKDIKICNFISDGNDYLKILKNRCFSIYYNFKALEQKNIKLCNNILDELAKNKCKSEVNLVVTKNTMVLKSCDVFTNFMQINSCKRGVLFRNAEEGIDKCNLVDDIMLQNECNQKLIIGKGIKEKTLKYCKENAIYGNICKESIIKSLNEKENTTKYCQLYTDSRLQIEQCKSLKLQGELTQ